VDDPDDRIGTDLSEAGDAPDPACLIDAGRDLKVAASLMRMALALLERAGDPPPTHAPKRSPDEGTALSAGSPRIAAASTLTGSAPLTQPDYAAGVHIGLRPSARKHNQERNCYARLM
jgi:hypothetical protein